MQDPIARQSVIQDPASAEIDAGVPSSVDESHLRTLVKIGEAFYQSDGDPYAKILGQLLAQFDSPLGFVGYIDDDGSLFCPTLTDEVWDSRPTAGVIPVFPRQSWGGLWGRVLIERRSLLKNELHQTPVGHHPIHRSMGAPIQHRDQVIGALHVANRANDYTPGDLEALDFFAAAVAPHLAARLEEDRRRRGADEKREMNLILKHRDNEIQELNAKLRQLEHDLVGVQQAAEASNRAKSEFLANISHEIRSPMTAILGFTDLLLQDAETKLLPHDWVGNLLTIKRNGEHLLGVVNGIFDLSRIEAGKCQIERTELSVPQLVADVVSLMRVRAHAKGLALEVAFTTAIPEKVEGDPARLRQILINLVGNAIKFTEMGKVRINLSRPEAQALQFDVIDSGIGIHEAQLHHLFDPFVQADSLTTRQFGGAGLGLAISRRLAELLGGSLIAESTLGKGSVFTLRIPAPAGGAVKMFKEFSEAISGAYDQPATPSPRRRPTLRHRILLVEDGPDNQRLISFHLRRAGAEVVVAADGQAALAAVANAEQTGQHFDVVVMDMQMPVMDGYEATRRLRAQGFERPILALTAHALPGDREKCLQAGCDEYAAKPIEPDRLIAQIASLVARMRQR